MDEIINLDGQDFLITDKILFNQNPYIFALALDESREFTILEEFQNTDGTFHVASVRDKDIIRNVINIINQKSNA